MADADADVREVSETSSPTPTIGSREAGERAAAVVETMLAAADVGRVYAEPLRHGDTVLIPAAEVLAVAGFGMGSGSGVGGGPEGRPRRGTGGGGGGGGRSFARAVAVVVATPGGVRVEPVFDWTKIALAALTAAGFVFAAWKGMKSPRRF